MDIPGIPLVIYLIPLIPSCPALVLESLRKLGLRWIWLDRCTIAYRRSRTNLPPNSLNARIRMWQQLLKNTEELQRLVKRNMELLQVEAAKLDEISPGWDAHRKGIHRITTIDRVKITRN